VVPALTVLDPPHRAPRWWRPRWASRAWVVLGRHLARWNARGFTLLAGRNGPLVVGISGAAGLPPLLAVAFYAGASPMGYWAFTAACLAGRTVRFGVIALAPGLF
jgi:membrane protein YqaA with SNARE-associated domain